VIEVDHLTFSYKKGGEKILDDLSFTMEDGQLVAVLGANGAGKSTLFRCMLGLMKHYNDIRSMSRREMARHVAYIPQSETPVYNYTVMDSVLMGTTGQTGVLSSPGPEQIKAAEEAIGYLGIGHLAERGVNEISGGERQLAFLARAMAQHAKILIMDEPTANLDYGNQQHVLNHIKKMAQEGYTILLSTHNPEHALQHATQVLALKDRHILEQGDSMSVLDEELIEKIYGLRVKIIETIVAGKTVRSCVPAGEE